MTETQEVIKRGIITGHGFEFKYDKEGRYAIKAKIQLLDDSTGVILIKFQTAP